jgi:hypothetical protein
MTVNPIVLGLLIALAIVPWIIITVHMYVYHWRKQVDGVKLYEKARADYLEYGPTNESSGDQDEPQ